MQLQSAVLRICALAGSESEFIAGDVLGTLYGVNQYGVLWSVRPSVHLEGGQPGERDRTSWLSDHHVDLS